jgi:hypothetical protein
MFACWRQAHSPTVPEEYRRAEPGFDGVNAAAHRTVRDAKLVGC